MHVTHVPAIGETTGENRDWVMINCFVLYLICNGQMDTVSKYIMDQHSINGHIQ